MKVKIRKATIHGHFKDEIIELEDKIASRFISVGLAVEIKAKPKKEVKSLD